MQNRLSSSPSRLLAAVFYTLLLHTLGSVTGVHAAPASAKCTSSTSMPISYMPSPTMDNVQETDTPYAPSNGGNSNGTTGGDFVKLGYYASWSPKRDFPWTSYTHMAYAFVVVNSTADCLGLNTDDQVRLPEFVKNARANNVKPLISVGGWTGSLNYSTAVATADNRQKFIKALLGLIDVYQADGIDFDWEHPNDAGIGCNQFSGDDTANFLTFLQELRKQPEAQKLHLSAAVRIQPFYGTQPGVPVTDVSGFAQVLDHITIMAYDLGGPWNQVISPNAPLTLDGCNAPTGTPPYSATSAVNAWSAAGFPKNKIVLGVPAYGHSFGIDTQSYNMYEQPASKNYNPAIPADPAVDVCGTVNPGTDTYPFSQLVTDGYLNADGTASSSVQYKYDDCTQTPFITVPGTGSNNNGAIVITYDDPTSFKAKGNFVRCQELGGFGIWDSISDNNGVLVNAISQALEGQGSCS